ncbi:MAG: serine/threonine protein kinase [Sandaracinaceae bacterium]|nr:serine/threonine protein kinase [Sandaracinaceae bacterium]
MKIGPYTILERIARGGWADVYKARRGPRGPVVCLKQVRSEFSQSVDFVALFLREIEIAERLRHPNVVPVYEHGEDQGYYYVMELVEGADLNHILSGAAPLEPALVAYLARELARALVYIHHRDPTTGGKALVHADISPHNVLVSQNGEVKLSDFGIARALSESGAETVPTTFRGKRLYASPEQWEGATISSRSDLFSLGIVLWRALLRTHPYAEDLPRDSSLRMDEWVRLGVLKNRRRTRDDLGHALPHAPAPLLDAVDALLQPVASRMQTAEELLARVGPLAAPDGAAALAELVVQAGRNS